MENSDDLLQEDSIQNLENWLLEEPIRQLEDLLLLPILNQEEEEENHSAITSELEQLDEINSLFCSEVISSEDESEYLSQPNNSERGQNQLKPKLILREIIQNLLLIITQINSIIDSKS